MENAATGVWAVMSDVWNAVSGFITFANTNTIVWVPVGFSIGRATVSLFRKAVSFGGRRR